MSWGWVSAGGGGCTNKVPGKVPGCGGVAGGSSAAQAALCGGVALGDGAGEGAGPKKSVRGTGSGWISPVHRFQKPGGGALYAGCGTGPAEEDAPVARSEGGLCGGGGALRSDITQPPW